MFIVSQTEQLQNPLCVAAQVPTAVHLAQELRLGEKRGGGRGEGEGGGGSHQPPS